MRRKLKPQFLIIGVCLAVAIVIIFIVLYVCAVQKSAETSTPDTAVTTVVPDGSEATVESTVAETTTEAATKALYKSIKQIIIDEGLRVDENDNVTDADGIKYPVTYGKIKIVCDGNLYTIDIDQIREQNGTRKASVSSNTSSTRKEPDKQSSSYTSSESNTNNSNTSNNNNNNSYVENNQNTFNNYIPDNNNVQQAPPEKPVQKSTEKPQGNGSASTSSNIHMSYKTLTVNKNNVFSLTLTGAGNNVTWKIGDSSLISRYESNGNSCSFKAIQHGSTVITATYQGLNYDCSITIK